jgi:GDP-4-dehydro-6-deoxy-D-mannose reductase
LRVLITGAGGFVGKHLSRHLLENQPGIEIHGTSLESTPYDSDVPVIYHKVDLRDAETVQSLIEKVRPDHIYHLAAQSSPSASFADPWDTIENNVRPQVNIFQTCLALKVKPRILIISSAEIYPEKELPIDEDTQFRPVSPYGVSKVSQEMLGLQYYEKHELPIVRVRPFNHTGPGQREGFIAPDFAMKIAKIEAGQQTNVIEVRNLKAQLDFTDVRDVVRAYALLMEKGMLGEVYNLASGKIYRAKEILDILLNYSHIHPEIVPTANQRDSLKTGSAERLRRATGWEPTIPFEQTLLDLLNDCRQRVQR